MLFQPNLHFRFELERIIDDWILLGFLVGNDFVPHLPHMHINQDALPYLYGIYKEFMPTTDGNCFFLKHIAPVYIINGNLIALLVIKSVLMKLFLLRKYLDYCNIVSVYFNGFAVL